MLNTMKNNRPILVTGVPRSGATFIIRILEMCGANIGLCSSMYENILIDDVIDNILLSGVNLPRIAQENVDESLYPLFNDITRKILLKQKLNSGNAVLKNSGFSLSWRYWNKMYPNAQWVIVRRKSPYIVNSCVKTSYMGLMKSKSNLHMIKAADEREGWMWYIHRFEEQWLSMAKAGLDLKEVYPDRMENSDYHRIQQLVVNLGLEWNEGVEKVMSIYFKEKEEITNG